MDLSVVIVNYKSRGLTLNCLKSIREADWSGLCYEIIVVDNDSRDSIGDIIGWQYPDIKFIQNSKNLGMGAANNVGARQARGKYLVIMNPDTMVFKDTFKKMYHYLESQRQVGLAGPRQYYPDRTIQASCFRWLKLMTPLYRRTPLGRLWFARRELKRFLMEDFDHASIRPVDWLLGSFLFCRADMFKRLGGFDERFFLYFEDTDLCRRCWQKGWQVVYFAEAQIIHNHLRHSAQEPWYKFFWSPAARHHLASWIKYLRKWGIKNEEYYW